MRTRVLALIVGLLFSFSSINISLAGPPMTGSSKDGNGWSNKLNPTQWTLPPLPKMPWTVEPARIKKKTPSVMTTMNKSAKNSWEKTTRALDPSRMFEGDSKPKSQAKSTSNGFLGGLFKPAEPPKEIHTVNDFLSQPQPRQ